VGGMEKLLPDPVRPGAGGDDADLLDVHRRSARNEQAMEAFGNDLGGQACDREQDGGTGGREWLVRRRETPSCRCPPSFGGRLPSHRSLPPALSLYLLQRETVLLRFYWLSAGY
jgi:hypothetical protein